MFLQHEPHALAARYLKKVILNPTHNYFQASTLQNSKMRRIARLEASIDLVKAGGFVRRSSPYLCLSCRHQATSFSTSTIRTAGGKGTEKLRRMIWGNEQPAGLEDPYGDGNILSQAKKRGREDEAADRRREWERRSVATPELSNYEASSTWDGLVHVGGEDVWAPKHPFRGFLPADILTDNDEITAALHRSMVEVFALQQAGKPLEDISKVIPLEDLTTEVQLSPHGKEVTLRFPQSVSLDDIVESLAPAVGETFEKEAPTESEEDVAADRSTIDPLHPESVETSIETPTANENPTESEEDVTADRSSEDPLHSMTSQITFEELIASWGTEWLQITLENPEIKLAVSVFLLNESPCVLISKIGTEAYDAIDRNSNFRCGPKFFQDRPGAPFTLDHEA
jgi:hypothetical protein